MLVISAIFSLRYKFDDERVTKEDMKRALEEQYGGEEEVGVFRIEILCPHACILDIFVN